jgi:CRP/FNR family transcriptional regulator, cyclic AMP receptor protein
MRPAMDATRPKAAERTWLLREDPDLGAALEASARAVAEERVVARTITVRAGLWAPAGERERGPGHLGFLVLDGLLLRNLDLHGASTAELVGAGDVIRPWAGDRAEPTLAAEATWEVVERARLAVLDRGAAATIGRWPELMATLLDRSIQRTHGLAFHLAVCSLPRLETRVLAVLWNLAGRWGRVTPRGVVLALPISHRVLAHLVSARRPSVTVALGRLSEHGLVERGERVGWVLRGDPPAELDEIRRRLADRPEG